MSKLKYIIPCLIAGIIAAVVFSSFGADSERISISEKELLVSSDIKSSDIFSCSAKPDKMKKIASSGVLEMYLDEKTLGVCILDTISGKLWRSLPEKDKDKNAANLKVNIIIKGREYTLNSQRDSLYLDCAVYNTSDSGILTLTYTFRKNLENGRKIDLTVPVRLMLADGALAVKVNCKSIEDKSTAKVYIKSIEVLPCFGACSKAQEGDYILLPSASGVIMDIYRKTENIPEITLPVYGEDIGKNAETDSFVPIGAFGMKSTDSAFVCLIDSADASSSVKAKKGDGTSVCSRVGAEFEVTASIVKDGSMYLSKTPYEGEFSLSYRFLSGNNADYITMAGACRELLIRQGRLTDGKLSSGDYPFNISLIGSTEEKGITTTDEQAEELLSSLITKGIGNISIMLSDTEKRDIRELSDFASKNGLSLSLSRSLFSYGKNADLTLSGEINSRGLTISEAEKTSEDIIQFMRKNSAGVLLTDCGRVLPASYSKFTVASRNEMLVKISDICTALSSHGRLSISGANIYALKYADSIINIPETSPLEKYSCCSGVPFLEAVLHGICDYSFTAVNLSPNPVKAMLKTIEYGAVPHYEWYFGQYEEDDALHYMSSLSQARLLYENMKKMFSDLRDQRIISHETVKENLTRTVYSSGSEIYVNYSDKAMSSGGIIVDPLSFLRVN